MFVSAWAIKECFPSSSFRAWPSNGRHVAVSAWVAEYMIFHLLRSVTAADGRHAHRWPGMKYYFFFILLGRKTVSLSATSQ
jgi:hypothetical protein